MALTTAERPLILPSRAAAWLRQFSIAVVMLAPLGCEAVLRVVQPRGVAPVLASQGAAAYWPLLGLYAVACLVFALLAPSIGPLHAAVSERRPRLKLVALTGAALTLQVTIAAWSIHAPVLAPLWLAAGALWLFAWRGSLRWPTLSRPEWIALAVLVALAAALRLYRLDDLQGLQNDEDTLIALLFVRSAENPFVSLPLFAQERHVGDGWSHIILGMYRRIWLLDQAGISIGNLRLPTALVSIAEIPLIVLLGRQLFGFRVGLIAGAVATTLTLHLTFSRHGGDYNEAALVWTLSTLFLVRGIAKRSIGSFALAGIVYSLSMYVYFSARPLVVVVAALLVTAAFDPALRGRWLLRAAGAFAAGTAVGMGPLLVPYSREPLIFFYKTTHAGWITHALEQFSATGDAQHLQIFQDQIGRAALAYTQLEISHYHFHPERALFTWLPGALAMAGIAVAFTRLADWRFRLLTLWVIGFTALSATGERAPQMHRLLPLVPAFGILIGLAVESLIARWGSLGGVARRAAWPVATAALAVAFAHESAFYFGDYVYRDASADPWASPMVRRVLAMPDGQHVGVLPGLYGLNARMLNFATDRERRGGFEAIDRIVDQVPESRPRPQGLMYLVQTPRQPWLGLLREAYPIRREEIISSVDPRYGDLHRWTVLVVPPEEVERQRGLRLVARDAVGRQIELRAGGLVSPPLPADVAYPVDLEWHGWLHLSSQAEERVWVASTGSTAAWLRLADHWYDLSNVTTDSPVWLRLGPGGQPLYAAARVGGPEEQVQVLSARPGDDWGIFADDRAVAWPGAPRLTLEWLDGRGSVLRREYDATITENALGLRKPSDAAVALRYKGELAIEQAGRYELELIGDGPAAMWVGDRRVWPLPDEAPRASGRGSDRDRVWLTLVPGHYPLVVERDLREGGGKLALLWRRPGQDQTIMPPSAFTPVTWPGAVPTAQPRG